MISFIIPAKNEEAYIADCLRSIMGQTVSEPFEIIVVDNNSGDNTSKTVSQVCPGARVVVEEARGTSAARHKGFLEAKGEWLVFLDADVRLSNSQWLRLLLGRISQPGVVAVSSHYRYYEVPTYQSLLQGLGTFLFIYPWIFITNTLFRHSAHMVGGMMVIKRKALLKAEGFGVETEFYGDETLISKKLYAQGRIVVSPGLWVYTSGRRYIREGMVKTVYKYVLNYFWALFTGRPYHRSI